MLLRGKGAVITGGGRGIGASTARALATAGAAVVVAARSEDEIGAVAAELRQAGHSAWAVPCDVADPASIESLADAANERLDSVDVLVNNAGVAPSAPLAKLSLEEWDRVFAVNARAPFLCTRAFVPAMVERGWGRVVNMASVASLSGARYIAAYAASKHALLGFTRCIADEVEGTGVTVNAICPAYVDTPMTDAGRDRIAAKTGIDPGQVLAKILESAGQSRLIDPEEVAAKVLELCGDGSEDINGDAIVINGSEPAA